MCYQALVFGNMKIKGKAVFHKNRLNLIAIFIKNETGGYMATTRNTKKKAHTKKSKKLFATAAGAIVLIAAAIVWGVVQHTENTVSFHLGSQQVTTPIFKQVMEQQIGQVTLELQQKGYATGDQAFWTEEKDGQKPVELLKDRTMEQLRKLAAAYELAKEEGIEPEGGLGGVINRMEQENKDRAQKIQNGQVVYGLSNFSFSPYVEYELSWMESQYCVDLDNPNMQISDEERQRYYEENKQTQFQKNDDIALDYIRIDCADLDQQQIETRKAQLVELSGKISADNTLAQAAKQYPDLQDDVEQMDLASSEVSSYTRIIGDVLDYAADLTAGQATQVIDENGFLYLIQCTSRTVNDYMPMDQVVDNINKALREQRYQQLLEQKASELTFDGNDRQLIRFCTKQLKR